jgi:3-oxoacyl-[acyl-carrier protein] reductase
MPTLLANKHALVTGASRGIGAAIARRLAADGAAVAIHYNAAADKAEQVARDISDASGVATTHQADLSQPNGAADLAKQLAKPIDLLVNNAGIAEFVPLADESDELIDRTWTVNVRSVLILSREITRTMPDGGRLVHIGSVAGEAATFAGNSVYSMSKFALRGLSRGFARDLGPRGITSNVVQPGPIDTDLNPADHAGADGQRAMTALGRYGTPDEVASAVAWLCSPEASYVTAAELNVAGGWGA